MSKQDAAACVLWAGATLYAIFGGADFGAGLWDLTAGTARGGAPMRGLIERAIGPVWEANHVWLIFCLVVLWTGFPAAFGPLMSTLCLPLAIAALGIVLRGSAFAFRKVAERLERQRLYGAVFALSSILTPFFMGTVVGAVASGRVPAHGAGDRLSSWTGLTSIVIGALFVAASAYVSAVFLLTEARSAGDSDLERAFVRRALIAAVAAGALGIAGVVVVHSDARSLYDGLVGDALPLVIVSIVCGIGALALLATRGGGRGVRPLAVGAVAAVVWGWGVAQHPDLLPGALTLNQAAAPGAALTALLVVVAVAAAVVGPSLGLLYVLQQRSLLDEHGGAGAAERVE